MKNKVVVSIGGNEYKLIAEENEGYTKKVAAFVDEKFKDIIKNAGVGTYDAAILTAVNIADEYYKSLDTSENLRRQLKDYLEDATRTKLEVSELKRELSKCKR